MNEFFREVVRALSPSLPRLPANWHWIPETDVGDGIVTITWIPTFRTSFNDDEFI